GKAYASVSQDYDNLIFGCPCLVRNLSLEGKRKKAGKFAYEKIAPELILLEEVLANLTLELEQLIVLAILVGTDYNPGGVKGIGPKNGLKLLKEHGKDFQAIFEKVEWDKHYPELSWKEIFDTIKNIPVTDEYKLEWKPLNEKEILELLVREHDFSEERVKARLEKLKELSKGAAQKGLGSFF
ncbi:MAG: flap structure-specific endonuclease, partial [Nanoarchaeota archaeon]